MDKLSAIIKRGLLDFMLDGLVLVQIPPFLKKLDGALTPNNTLIVDNTSLPIRLMLCLRQPFHPLRFLSQIERITLNSTIALLYLVYETSIVLEYSKVDGPLSKKFASN